jgi:hypothetical protein
MPIIASIVYGYAHDPPARFQLPKNRRLSLLNGLVIRSVYYLVPASISRKYGIRVNKRDQIRAQGTMATDILRREKYTGASVSRHPEKENFSRDFILLARGSIA